MPLGAPIVGEQVGLAEAQVRVPFQVPLPSYVPNSAALAEVWASPKDVKPSMRSLAFVYSNGLTIIIHQEDEATNWEALATPPFTLININGHAGVGKDPGKEEVMGEWYDYPGSVSWQVGRLQISVYSQHHSMEELIRLAKSMEIR